MCLWIWACVGRTFIPDIFLHHQHTNPTPATHKHTQTHTHTHTQGTFGNHHFSRTCKTGQCCMTIFKDTAKRPLQKHHRNNTTTQPPKHNHKTTTQNTTTKTPPHKHHHKNTTTTPPPQKHNLKNTYSTTPYHKVLHFTTVLSTRPARTDERIARRHSTVLSVLHARSHERGCHGQPKNSRFTTVLNVRHVRSDERVARPPPKFAFYHSFERPTRNEITRRLPWSAEKFAFYHSSERPTRPKWRKGSLARSKICVLPQFWAPNTSEVTKRSPRHVKNLRFTTVLNVRHVRSDERVARRAEKFAFYHSFERPTRPKWRKDRSAG